MKSALKTGLFTALLLAHAHAAFAGPLRSKLIVGTSEGSEFDLIVPAKKAVTLINFIDSFSDRGRSGAFVFLPNEGGGFGPASFIMQGIFGSADVAPSIAPKEVTIVGPATIRFDVPNGQTSVVTYKIFAN